MDARGILDELFQSGKQFLDKGRDVAEDKLGVPEDGEKREAMVSGLGKGAIAGGLAALLLGTKGGRKVTGKVVKYGSLAAVATVAYKAYQTWTKGDTTTDAATSDGESINELSEGSAQQRGLLLVRAMIAAANADGHIDAEEKQTIQAKLTELDLSDETLAGLQAELVGPLTPDQLALQVDSRAAASEVYLLSSLIVDEANPMERSYLNQLARALGLPPELTAKLEQEAFV